MPISVKVEWKDRFTLTAEDYLHGLISLVNELVGIFLHVYANFHHSMPLCVQSRLAVNSVTMGNFEEPIKISAFVKDIFAGFAMVLYPLVTL